MIDCDCETDGSSAALVRTQRTELTLVTRTAVMVTTRDWSQVLCPKKGFQPFSHLYDLMTKCVRTSWNGEL